MSESEIKAKMQQWAVFDSAEKSAARSKAGLEGEILEWLITNGVSFVESEWVVAQLKTTNDYDYEGLKAILEFVPPDQKAFMFTKPVEPRINVVSAKKLAEQHPEVAAIIERCKKAGKPKFEITQNGAKNAGQ